MKIASKEKKASNFRWPTLLAATALTLAAIAAYAGYRLGTPSTARARAPSAASPLRAGAMALNFGAFPFGQHPVVRFMLTNTAARPIQIMHLVPSCDCISAACTPRAHAAGPMRDGAPDWTFGAAAIDIQQDRCLTRWSAMVVCRKRVTAAYGGRMPWSELI